MRQGVRNQSAALRNPDKLGSEHKRKRRTTQREEEGEREGEEGVEKMKAETKIECKWHEILSNEIRA